MVRTINILLINMLNKCFRALVDETNFRCHLMFNNKILRCKFITKEKQSLERGVEAKSEEVFFFFKFF